MSRCSHALFMAAVEEHYCMSHCREALQNRQVVEILDEVYLPTHVLGGRHNGFRKMATRDACGGSDGSTQKDQRQV